MKSLDTRIAIGVGVISLWVVASGGLAGRPGEEPIGMFTAVQGNVTVAHSGTAQPVSVNLRDHVLFRDTIETQRKSHTKALLNDDSLLTVGEHSKIEITEHIYNPASNSRSVIINLLKGKVRALVNKVFTGSESRFEVRTPTAVAAARGTYFVVWFHNGTSGIANLGTRGRVDFTSEGITVAVDPGQFSLAFGDGGPLPPAPLAGDGVPAQVGHAVNGTEVKDVPASEAAQGTVNAFQGNQGIGVGVDEVPPGHGGENPGDAENNDGVGIGVGETPPGMDVADGSLTPPAVTSGAAGGFGFGAGRTPPPPFGDNPPGQSGNNPGAPGTGSLPPGHGGKQPGSGPVPTP